MLNHFFEKRGELTPAYISRHSFQAAKQGSLMHSWGVDFLR